ncbi:hypothetical protein EJ06DRAFT_560225 [Trichodelitschia bisporula]|uniref:AB hydrolase-1 domain-containing protein n=1 Tax=Trichodelitschia bisporula TaxID=703511 RepID=A0A6G1HJE7_9PEZI|nr:hypothetical protein EJ06DRAFT_560225 [Trichodelitschia bisporula]
MSSFPTVVIVHDAWLTPEHYATLIDELTSDGFPVACPHLPTGGENAGFNDDCSFIHSLVFDLACEGHPILILAHGYGAFVATEVAHDLSWKNEAKKGQQRLAGGVVGLIFLASFLPSYGHKWVDSFGGEWPDFIPLKDGKVTLVHPEALFNSLGNMQRMHWITHLGPFNAKVGDIVITAPVPAWIQTQTTYVVCEQDLLCDKDLALKNLDNARRVNPTAKIDTEVLQLDHNPFLADSKAISHIVTAAAVKAKDLIGPDTSGDTDGANDACPASNWGAPTKDSVLAQPKCRGHVCDRVPEQQPKSPRRVGQAFDSRDTHIPLSADADDQKPAGDADVGKATDGADDPKDVSLPRRVKTEPAPTRKTKPEKEEISVQSQEYVESVSDDDGKKCPCKDGQCQGCDCEAERIPGCKCRKADDGEGEEDVEGEGRDPYRSWDSGLADYGDDSEKNSVSTTGRSETAKSDPGTLGRYTGGAALDRSATAL